MHYISFNNNSISRIIKGNWQLAGGHGDIDRQAAIDDLFAYVSGGINTFDVGDIYTGVEEIVGEFLQSYRKRFGILEANKLRVHTKFVPDLNALDELTKDDVRFVIERSIERLGLKKLHLVQFHWWDYRKGDYIQAARYLKELQDEGLIEAIGLTNFDIQHTKALIDAGIPIVSHQIQFSLVDPRPFNGMLDLAIQNNIAIFCYGVLAGGLLGQSRPGDEPTNRSHIKYQLMLREVGADYYHMILDAIDNIAATHKTTSANIAAAYILQTPGVSNIILGPRNSQHLEELDELSDTLLNKTEYSALAKLHKQLLASTHDDIYSYERDMAGPHASIMKYNNNGIKQSHNEKENTNE